MMSLFDWVYLFLVVLTSGCCHGLSIAGVSYTARRSPARSWQPSGKRIDTTLLQEPVGTDTTAEISTSHHYKESLTIRESYRELIAIPPGGHVVSDIFTVDDSFDFRVKVYPRGGGQRPTSGFGMAYKVLPAIFQDTTNARIGVYLQFLPRFPEQSVDASFSLRLKGQQSKGRRFDVEWRAGMRFQSETNLKRGVASDFGAHLMQTALLKEFLGISETDNDGSDTDARLIVEVEIKIHNDKAPSGSGTRSGPFWEDVRMGNLRVACVVVPVLKKLSERPDMMAQGVYPGVEYRILRILQDGKDIFHHKPGVTYEMKPIYPLVQQLERPWPVAVRETDISTLITPNAYNTGSAVLSLATAVLGLAFALWLSTAVSFFYIPSRSMEPTLQIGDVLLVEKVSMGELHRGDIVLFQPPTALQNIVAQSGGRLNPRDLFVKRVAGLPGDSYRVDPRSGSVQVNDESVQNQRCEIVENGVAKFLRDGGLVGSNKEIPDDNVLVLGDCGNVSIDSRVWGPLPKSNLVGRPLLRVWPMNRMGSVR
jgi:signal peptidase I